MDEREKKKAIKAMVCYSKKVAASEDEAKKLLDSTKMYTKNYNLKRMYQ